MSKYTAYKEGYSDGVNDCVKYMQNLEMYRTNADFKTYVDKYMRKEEIDLETALSHAMVQNYANYLIDRGDAEPTLRNLWKNDEDKGC